MMQKIPELSTILGSGSSHHICKIENMLTNLVLKSIGHALTGNSGSIPIYWYDEMGVFDNILLSWDKVLDPVIVLSVELLTKNGYKVNFHEDQITVYNQNCNMLI